MRYDSGAHNENLSSSASSFQLSPPLKRLFNACLSTAKCRAAFPRDDWAGSLWIFPRSNYVSPRTYGFIFLARLQHSSTDPTTQISDGRSDISSRWQTLAKKRAKSEAKNAALSIRATLASRILLLILVGMHELNDGDLEFIRCMQCIHFKINSIIYVIRWRGF